MAKSDPDVQEADAGPVDTPNQTDKKEKEQDEDKIVTAYDVLVHQEQLEREAAEVFPGDVTECSFSRGYVMQKVYACRTCAAKCQDSNCKSDANGNELSDPHANKEYVGVCYGCFVSCHTTHDVVELFHRRSFRCDCGTSRLVAANTICELDPSRIKACETNTDNRYNHNFENVFCICNTLYDPETEPGTMHQCVICEDWFHDRCVSGLPADEDAFDDLVCSRCVGDRAGFLLRYCDDPAMFYQGDDAQVDVCGDDGGVSEVRTSEPAESNLAVNASEVATAATSSIVSAENEAVHPEENGLGACVMPNGPECVPVFLFPLSGWQQRLCRCQSCLNMYSAKDLDFLLDANPETYEPAADTTVGESLHEAALRVLDRTDRVAAIHGVEAFNRLRERLMKYLREIAKTGEVVTKRHIQSFFDDMREKEQQQRFKRQRLQL